MRADEHFAIDGPPPFKGRPRFTKQGHVYTDDKTKAAELRVRAAYLEQCAGHGVHIGPIEIHIAATFTTPASWPLWKQRLCMPHVTKPDTDNVAKAVCDALNGLAFIDDSQVTALSVCKRYGRAARTDVLIRFGDLPERGVVRGET